MSCAKELSEHNVAGEKRGGEKGIDCEENGVHDETLRKSWKTGNKRLENMGHIKEALTKKGSQPEYSMIPEEPDKMSLSQ